MTREEFLLEMDEILGLQAGTLQGHEKLDELETWDSTALITLTALAETKDGANLSPQEIASCSTVADLLRLARVESSSIDGTRSQLDGRKDGHASGVVGLDS